MDIACKQRCMFVPLRPVEYQLTQDSHGAGLVKIVPVATRAGIGSDAEPGGAVDQGPPMLQGHAHRPGRIARPRRKHGFKQAKPAGDHEGLQIGFVLEIVPEVRTERLLDPHCRSVEIPDAVADPSIHRLHF